MVSVVGELGEHNSNLHQATNIPWATLDHSLSHSLTYHIGVMQERGNLQETPRSSE